MHGKFWWGNPWGTISAIIFTVPLAFSLNTVTIKNHKFNSKFDSAISVARNVISVT